MINNEHLKCSGEDCFANNRFQNNFINGSVDHVSYRGVSIEQRPEVTDKFESLILEYKPSQIIEIGTFAGGLTLILKDIVDIHQLNTEIYTYDVAKASILIDQIQYRNLSNINVNTSNLFSANYDDFYDNNKKDEITSLIQKPGITLLLCDGGCKKCEFNLLSDLLKTEDIIMAHDYAPDEDYFKSHMHGKIWYWHEIKDSDISQAILRNNLLPIHKESFLDVAWLCVKKTK